MTSTVLDVSIMLLCVSASVVSLGGIGGDAAVRGPTAEETADRLVTETVTVRYRAPDAANGTRTVHATRAELLALLAASPAAATDGRGVGERDAANDGGFGPRATAAVTAGLRERTRVDVVVPTTAGRERRAGPVGLDRRGAAVRGARRHTGPIAAPGTPRAPQAPRLGGAARRPSDGDELTVAVGAEPPPTADVTTAVVTHPAPEAAEADGTVRIVVRRW